VSRARNTAFLNLLFRSLKRDKVDIRAAAFIKRMCMCMCQASSPIAAGLLFLISEVCACKPQILRLLTDPPTESSHENVEEIDYFLMGDYDALKREPEYACRAQPSVWELCLMRTHFHPSVSAFTASLLNDPSHKITFDGNTTTMQYSPYSICF
jgi:ribosome biogenesis protein MAK21